MTIGEAKELKVGDRVRMPSGRVCQVNKIHERGILLEYWPVKSAHGGWYEWHELSKVEKL